MMTATPTLTNQGQTLLMRAIGGETITFTRFKIGDGQLPSGQTIETLTDIISLKLAFPVTDIDTTQTGLAAVTGEFDSDDIAADFFWREMGIFAKGEDNVEILYAYANDGANAGKLKAINTDVLTKQHVTFIVAISTATSVTAVFTPMGQHVHSASDITSGTLPAARGGTGVTTVQAIRDMIAVSGTFTGDGTVKRLISLGFRPSAVLLCDSRGNMGIGENGIGGGIAVGTNGLRSKGSTSLADATTWDNAKTALLIADTGFYVNYAAGGTGTEQNGIATNTNGESYRYVAFK